MVNAKMIFLCYLSIIIIVFVLRVSVSSKTLPIISWSYSKHIKNLLNKPTHHFTKFYYDTFGKSHFD